MEECEHSPSFDVEISVFWCVTCGLFRREDLCILVCDLWPVST